MSVVAESLFGKTTRKSEEWMQELMQILSTGNPDDAYEAFKAVTHELRDRLGTAEASQIAAQMPVLLRGAFYEGWRPTAVTNPAHTAADFVQGVSCRYRGPNLSSTQEMVTSVFALLEDRISRGEIDDVKSVLPKSIRELWPNLTAFDDI